MQKLSLGPVELTSIQSPPSCPTPPHKAHPLSLNGHGEFLLGHRSLHPSSVPLISTQKPGSSLKIRKKIQPSYLKPLDGNFPGSPVVKTPCCQCRGHRFDS